MSHLKITNPLLLSGLSGLLLFAGWPPSPLTLFLFIGIVPMLMAAIRLSGQKHSWLKFLLYVYIALFIWQGLACFWIYRSSLVLGFVANILNPLVTAFLLSFFVVVYRSSGKIAGYVYFISAWIGSEFILNHWQLGSPFMTLGHGLTMHPAFIQWYEYTGVHGGSLWILLVNLFLFELIWNFRFAGFVKFQKKLSAAGLLLMILLVPIFLSLNRYLNYEEKGIEKEILIVHPYNDCFTDKYHKNAWELTGHYLSLTKKAITENTEYVVWPETAITDAGLIEFKENRLFDLIRSEIKGFPDCKLVSGAIGYEIHPDESEIGMNDQMPYIKYSEEFGIWYYTYNCAIQLDTSSDFQFRSKAKLVPFQEMVPYPELTGFFNSIAKPLGIDWQFSVRKKGNMDVFTDGEGSVYPVICYESVYGEYISNFVAGGANALFILMNEGWYKSRTASLQFMYYASARAIENRRAIARSSNFGISCFIDQKGEITHKEKRNEPSVLKTGVRFNDNTTFYTSFGDYPGKLSVAVFIGLILFTGLRIKKINTKT